MSERPKLSIVLQSYNYARFLPKAIESVLNQTYNDWELIIIDDASTDESSEVIRSYLPHTDKIRYIQYEENKGTHISIDHGVREARGEYFHWLSADDFRDPLFFQLSMEALEADRNLGVVCSDFGYVTEERGRDHLMSFPLLQGVTTPKYFSAQEVVQLFQRTAFWIPGHTAIVKLRFLRAHGAFQARLREKTDWFLMHQVAFSHGVAYVPRTLSYLYLHTQSYSAKERVNKQKRRESAKEILRSIAATSSARKQLWYRSTLLGEQFWNAPLYFLSKFERWCAFFYLVRKKVWKFFFRPHVKDLRGRFE